MAVEFSKSFWENRWSYRRGVHRDLRCSILAAGLGKRMDPLTAHHLPKPLFPLGGKIPMAEVWVRRMVESGLTDITMNLCVLADTIRRHFRDGSKFGAQITYVDEDVPSGTLGGACKQALGRGAKQTCRDEKLPEFPAFSGSTLIVPSGDIVTNFDAGLLEEMYDIHKQAGAALTMILVPIPWERRKDYGTVLLRDPETRKGLLSVSGPVKDFREKEADSPSNLNNASIYMIETELLRTLDPLRTPADPDLEEPFYDFGKHVFPAILGRLPSISLPRDFLLWGVQYDGAWFDVGQKRDYLRVNEYLLDGQLDIGLPYEELPWGYLGTNVAIDFSRVTLHPPVIIGNNCVVEPGAVLGPYAIVGDGWVIEDGVTIRNSVLWERYSFFTDDGSEISAADRTLMDRHEVRRGVTIEESIVAGGAIQDDIREKTVDVGEDGRLGILPIDYVPQGRRA